MSNNNDSNDDNENEDDCLDLPYLFFLIKGVRFKIIRLLRFKELTLKEIIEQLGDNRYNYGIQRHLDQLIHKGIINRNHNNEEKSIVYGLTNLGKHIHDISFSMKYIWGKQYYFIEHSILDLPFRFYSSIGCLDDNHIIKGRPKIVRKLINMYKESKFIYNILIDVEGTNDVLDILINKLKGNLSFHTKTIFGDNSIMDPDREPNLPPFKPFKENGQIKQKMIDIIKISLVITDKSAFVAFPKENENHPDMDVIIYSEEIEFRNWCMDYFHHCWENADEFDVRRIKSIRE